LLRLKLKVISSSQHWALSHEEHEEPLARLFFCLIYFSIRLGMEYISIAWTKAEDYVNEHGFAAAEKHFIEALALLMIASAFILAVFLTVAQFKICYGRYTEESLLNKV
jgi:hypothetical protein